MGRLILLLLIAGGFVVFAAQNLAPVALVVLGVKTQALPLSAWILSFMAAGALTTLVLSGFFSLSKNAAVRKSAQREASKPRSPWAGAKVSSSQGTLPKNTVGFTSGGVSAGNQDDWERRSDRDDGRDDWAEPSPTSYRGRESSQPPVRDNIRDRSPGYRDSRTSSQPDPEPRSESRRSPLDQAGFSRREAAEPRKSNDVYDAEYRVLIPPYSSTPPAAEPKDAVKPSDPTQNPAKNPDDEDWV